MIYETIAQCVEDLTTRWGGLATQLDTILDELDAGDPYRAAVQTLFNQVNGFAQTPVDPALTVAGTQTRVSRIGELLTQARGILDQARQRAAAAINGNLFTLDQLSHYTNENVAQAATNTLEGLREIQANAEGCSKEIEELTTPEGQASNVAGIRGSIDQVATYPVLTRETGWDPPARSSSQGGTSSGGLGRSAESAIREILGWRPNAKDPKAFVAALTQSFECKEVGGKRVCEYVPRSYSVQADLGAVTGAQASIYLRAKKALEASSPLLQRLQSLRADTDKEESEAMREIVGAQWSSLVSELGREGGPRVQRVDTLFRQLLGATQFRNPENVGGDLGRLRREFGLRRDNVNTIEEEENLTNFLVVVDYVSSLRQSWDQQKEFFFQTTQVFFGTQMVLLARSLGVIAESVDEVRYAMDSVFVGAAERQSVRLRFANEAPIFIADLLDWTQRFASEEGPHLIREGGKRGVNSAVSTLEELHRLWRGARTLPHGGQQKESDLPDGYTTRRVQTAVDELGDHLSEALEQARAIHTPAGPATGQRPAANVGAGVTP